MCQCACCGNDEPRKRRFRPIALLFNFALAWLLLVVGGAAMDQAAARILDTLGAGPFIFNLGHGITPETPPEHVERLVSQVRAWRPGA